MSEEEMVDVRCPVDTRRMFARMRRGEISDGNLIEIACPECVKRYRTLGDRTVLRVLHRYDILGECIESDVIRSDG